MDVEVVYCRACKRPKAHPLSFQGMALVCWRCDYCGEQNPYPPKGEGT